MGTFQARLVLFAFFGLAAFISYNAIYLQEGPHPAPFSADVDTLNTGSTRIARGGDRGVSRKHASSRAGITARSETVRAVQRELISRGYEPGPADGLHGLLTRAAVMAYQHDKNLPVTGSISDKLLKQILLGAAGSKNASSAKMVIPEQTTAMIKAVQQILAKMGYEPGPVDGIMGAGTREAIKVFEKEQKMPVKGRISGALLNSLVKVTGAKLASIPSG